MVLRNQAGHHPPVYTVSDLPEGASSSPHHHQHHQENLQHHHKKRGLAWVAWALATALLLVALGLSYGNLPSFGPAQPAASTQVHITVGHIPGPLDPLAGATTDLELAPAAPASSAAPLSALIPRAAVPQLSSIPSVQAAPLASQGSKLASSGGSAEPGPPNVAPAPAAKPLPGSPARAAGTSTAPPSKAPSSVAAAQQQGAAPPAAAGPEAAFVPAAPSPGNSTASFDWRLYAWLYKDLNLTSKSQATEHYEQRGRAQGKCGSAVPAVLRYPMHSGLANQLYMHLIVLAVAEHLAQHGLPVEVLLPPAVQRAVVEEEEGSGIDRWEAAPLGTLFDVGRMQAYWQSRGVTLSTTNASHSVYDAKNELHMFYGNESRGCPKSVDIKNNLWMGYEDFTAKLSAVWRRQACPADAPGAEPPSCLELHFPQPLFLINSSSARPDTTVAAEGIFFAPSMMETAGYIIQRLQLRGPKFNGAFLQIEEDWAVTAQEAALLPSLDMMAEAGFDNRTTVYIASGVFARWSDPEVDKLERLLVSRGLCSSMHFKREILGWKAVEGLTSEQGTLIDLLVLSNATLALGSTFDTFSWYLRELRTLQGRPRDTFYAVESLHPKAALRKSGVLSFSRGLREALGRFLLDLPLDSGAAMGGLRFSRGLREARRSVKHAAPLEA